MRPLPALSPLLAGLCLLLGTGRGDQPAPRAKGDEDGPLPPGAVARLGTLRFRLGDGATAAVLSPDGRYVAVSARLEVRVLETATGKRVQVLRRDSDPTVALAFAPDGKSLAIAEYTGTLQLWDVRTGQPRGGMRVQAQPGNLARLVSVAFSGDGTRVAAAGSGRGQPGTLYVFDRASGKQLTALLALHGGAVQVCLSGDGRTLASWGTIGFSGAKRDPALRRVVQVWDVPREKELRQYRIDPADGDVVAAALSPSGKILAVRGSAGPVTVWDVATGKEVHRLPGSQGRKSLLEFSPDGKILATAGDSGEVLLWDAVTGKEIDDAGGPRARPIGLAFPPPRSPGVPSPRRRRPAGLHFPPRGQVLACGIDGQALCLWDVRTRRLLTPEGGHRHAVTAVAFPPGGKEVLSASADGEVRRWERATGKELARFALHEETPRRQRSRPLPAARVTGAAGLSPDGKYAVTEGRFDLGGVRVWEAASAKGPRNLSGPNGYGDCQLAFSADGRFLAAALGTNQAVSVWDLGSGARLRDYRPAGGTEAGRFGAPLALSPDGQLLAAWAVYRTPVGVVRKLHLWRAATGQEVWSVAEETPNHPAALAFSPDGTVLAVGFYNRIVFRDTATGAERRRLTARPGLSGLAFAPDGRTLATAGVGRDGPLYGLDVWELATGTVRHHYAGHRGPVTAMAFSADGGLLATGSADTTVLVWDQAGRFLADGSPPPADELWAGLRDARAGPAFRAVGTLVAHPEAAVTLLRERLRPAEARTAVRDELRKLLADLEAPRYAARERASLALERLGPAAADALRERLRRPAGAEVRRRIERLLDRLAGAVPPPDDLRALRGVEVLERLGTPAARRLLEELAGGAPGATLTVQARAALGRLRARP